MRCVKPICLPPNLDGNGMTDIYLRPTGFIESPQFHDGASARLAGTMLWFTQIELTERCDGKLHRQLIDLRQWDATKDGMSAANYARAEQIFERITASREALTLGERVIRIDQPQVMGILNMTPDSFSDGGKADGDLSIAAEAAIKMSTDGAAIIDIGGESTRPGAPLIWEGDEIKRVEPIISHLAATGTAISVDTRKAAVMAAAIGAGAKMINDVSALLYDDAALAVAIAAQVPVVLMHAPSQGSDPHKSGAYSDVVTDVFDWLDARIEAVVAAGIPRSKILIDPGIGFGKSLSENLAIINNLSLFHGLGCALLFGASRKRLVGALSNEAAVDQRLGGSIFLALKAVEQGAHIVRVHDVAETVQAIRVWRGLRDAALSVLAI
jgi:dihydropteroate synthase